MQDRGPLATRQGTPVPLAETHPRVWCQAPSTKHAGEAMCACACACCVCVLRVRVACCVRVKGGEGRTFFEAAEAPFFEAMVVFAFFEVAWSAFMKGPLPCYHLALKRQTADASGSLVDLGQYSARCQLVCRRARTRTGPRWARRPSPSPSPSPSSSPSPGACPSVRTAATAELRGGAAADTSPKGSSVRQPVQGPE